MEQVISVSLTDLDERRISSIDPKLAAVVRRAVLLWLGASGTKGHRLMVIEGLRSPERQAELYAQGRTGPGKIVTWTLKSKHIEGRAVDCAPTKGGVIAWNDRELFDLMAACFMSAAHELKTPIRWGADWDRDGKPHERGETDSPHFELIEV